MVDYSKWDKLKFSDSDEEEAVARSVPTPGQRSAPQRSNADNPTASAPPPPASEPPYMRLTRELANDLQALLPQMDLLPDVEGMDESRTVVAVWLSSWRWRRNTCVHASREKCCYCFSHSTAS